LSKRVEEIEKILPDIELYLSCQIGDSDTNQIMTKLYYLIDRVGNLERIIAKELTENDELGSEFVYVMVLKERVRELEEHLDTFCRCPSHGPSLIHIPDGEFDD
jgi:hypothetical protein